MTTYLTPFVDGAAIDLGKRWRKQILKFGKIRTNDGGELDINRDLANDVVEAYKEGAFDQVPFVLVNGDNSHPDGDSKNRYKPENFRGDIKSLEVTDDGVDMIMDPSPKGADLLRENPQLGVSARIRPNYERSDGKRFRAVIEHVAGTLSPVLTGMRPWAAADLSSTDDGDVIDLSDKEYQMPEATKTNDAKSTDPLDKFIDGLSDEDLRKLADQELTDEEKELLRGVEESDDTTEGDDAEDTDDTTAVTEQQPVTANLSREAQAAIDLARSDAQSARQESAAIRQQLADEKAEREADAYIAAGVPPVMVNLALPALAKTGQVIDLSDGKKTDTGAIIRGLLNESKGRVDLSREKGHTDLSAEEKEEHEQRMGSWISRSFPELQNTQKSTK
jgi:hypothetical protein